MLLSTFEWSLFAIIALGLVLPFAIIAREVARGPS